MMRTLSRLSQRLAAFCERVDKVGVLLAAYVCALVIAVVPIYIGLGRL